MASDLITEDLSHGEVLPTATLRPNFSAVSRDAGRLPRSGPKRCHSKTRKDQETAVPGVPRRRGFSTMSDIRLS